jgi:hypothetical protein
MDEYYEDEVVRDINEDLEDEGPVSNVDADEERDYPVGDWEVESTIHGENDDASERSGNEALEGVENTDLDHDAGKDDITQPEMVAATEVVTVVEVGADHQEAVEAAAPASEDVSDSSETASVSATAVEAPVVVEASSTAPESNGENPMTALWAKGYSHFIIAKHLGISTKQVRDDIEALGLSESQGKLDLPESHAYWSASLPEKREIERQLLAAENA